MGGVEKVMSNSPVQQTDSLILVDLYSQILECGNEFLQVHFSIHIFVQVRELQPQVLLVLTDIVNELSEAHIATIRLVGSF